MRELSTSVCQASSHPEIVVRYDPARALPEDAARLVGSLERMVAAGSTFRPGETLQVGWCVAQFRELGAGALTIYEPDLASFPISWVWGATNTISLQRLHLDTADSFGLREAAAFPSLLQSCLVCTNVGSTGPLFMERLNPSGSAPNDSGWFIGCALEEHNHNDPSGLKCISLYELIVCLTRVPLPFVALPVGALVSLAAGRPSAFLAGRALPIAPDSFIARLYSEAV